VLDIVGASVVKYLRGINLIYAEASVKSYYGYNAHGDVVQLNDGGGVMTKTYRYDAFGVEQDPVTSDTNVWRYCGEYWDVETETIYLRARYYNPRIGRFTQQDSFRGYQNNALSLNMYTYCYNNPLRYWDPSGRVPWDASNVTGTKDRENLAILAEIWEGNNASGDKTGMSQAVRQAQAIINKYPEVTAADVVNTTVDTFGGSGGSSNIGTLDPEVGTMAPGIYVVVHEVAWGLIHTNNYHASIMIIVDEDSKYYDNNKNFTENPPVGDLQYATIGAGGSSVTGLAGYVESGINRDQDVRLENKKTMIELDISGDAAINYLFILEGIFHSSIKEQYHVFAKGAKYNSNSFASGLIGAAYKGLGIDAPIPDLVDIYGNKIPGWDKPIRADNFGVGIRR